MTTRYVVFAGIDYGSEFHQVCLIDTEGRALRALVDHNFRILIAMLRTQTLYDPSLPRAQTS